MDFACFYPHKLNFEHLMSCSICFIQSLFGRSVQTWLYEIGTSSCKSPYVKPVFFDVKTQQIFCES